MSDTKKKDVESNAIQSLTHSPPFSFRYGDMPSSGFLESWNKQSESQRKNSAVLLQRTSFRDPKTGLVCRLEMEFFPDYPAVEWVLTFKNEGKQETALLEDIQALDVTWGVPKQIGWLYLRYAQGCFSEIDDFIPKEIKMGWYSRFDKISLSPFRGKSSCGASMPFFNLQMGDEGWMIAIGWSGQWQAQFDRFRSDLVRVNAGMEKTCFKLRPGEQVRTPRILLIHWKGEPIQGHNLLRRFILDYHTPSPGGKQVEMPVSITTWGGIKSSIHLEDIEVYKKHKIPYDYYWIDAGWYGGAGNESEVKNWGKHLGDWRCHPVLHPKGLKSISDAAHAAGMKFLLWIEPERAICGTPITREHPEWFFGRPEPGKELLFNLGHPEARRWLTDMVSDLIATNNIDCIRFDFNTFPLSYWRNADKPDRQGMTEIRYIDGLYEFWDELLRRHPHLLIDNCASGGMRIDLETMSRSVTLSRSDYMGLDDFDPIGGQVETFGLAYWVPFSATLTGKRPGDTYNIRSCMSAGMSMPNFSCVSFEKEKYTSDYPWEWLRTMLNQYRRARPLYYGDFYPLTECSASSLDWLVYQMDRPDLNQGMVMAFRRPDSPFAEGLFPLKGLPAEGVCEVEDADTGDVSRYSAGSLMKTGLTITMSKRPESRLIFYRKV